MGFLTTILTALRYRAGSGPVVAVFAPIHRIRVDTRTVHRARVDAVTVHRVRSNTQTVHRIRVENA